MASAPFTLDSVLGQSVFRADPALADLIHEADEVADATLGIVDFSTGTIAYIGASLREWTGIDLADLRSGGIQKVISFVKPGQVQHLAFIQAAFTQQARAIDFDPRSVQYLDLPWTVVSPKGELPLLSSSVVLTYTKSSDIGWAVVFQVRDIEGSLAVLANCKTLLRLIKERHNQVYVHHVSHPSKHPGLIQSSNPIRERITERELDVLVLLARGFSTSEVAEQLSIAANTVETHRKKLHDKFEARNVAELIQKASKVYWLGNVQL